MTLVKCWTGKLAPETGSGAAVDFLAGRLEKYGIATIAGFLGAEKGLSQASGGVAWERSPGVRGSTTAGLG